MMLYVDSRNVCLEKEKKLAAQLIAQKAAQKQLTARRKTGGTQTTKKRQSSATSILRHGIIGQKRKKVCYLFHTRTHTIIKQNWSQFLLGVKTTALKQRLSKLYPQILNIHASDHIYLSQWPAINLKASFCA